MVNVGYENCVEFVRKEVIPFRERTDLSKVRWESTKPLESLDYRSLYPVYTVSINTKYFSSYQKVVYISCSFSFYCFKFHDC